MKQHITQEQLKELDIKVLEKFFKNHYYYYDGIEDEEFWTEGRYIHTESLKCAFGNFASSICIGKMIEILDKTELISIERGRDWTVEPTKNIRFQEGELCDALWETLKHLLRA